MQPETIEGRKVPHAFDIGPHRQETMRQSHPGTRPTQASAMSKALALKNVLNAVNGSSRDHRRRNECRDGAPTGWNGPSGRSVSARSRLPVVSVNGRSGSRIQLIVATLSLGGGEVAHETGTEDYRRRERGDLGSLAAW